MRRTQLLNDRETVHAGKHDIEEDQIEVFRHAEIQGFFSVKGQKNGVAFAAQCGPEEVGHALFVFGNKDAHVAKFRPAK